MRGNAGYTVIELLLAAAVLLAAAGGMFSLLHTGVARSVLWNEAADLHQRSRVAAQTLSSVIGAAGAGPAIGPLQHFFTAIEPRRRPSAGPSASAITVRSVPAHAPWATLRDAVPSAAGMVSITPHSGCPDGARACGFEPGMDAVIFDGTGNWDTVLIQSTGPDTLFVTDRAAARTTTYAAGAWIAQIEEVTLYFEAAEGVLRREHPGASNLPLLDNVIDLQFAYFGDPSPPVRPRPPAGAANCLYDSTGAPVPLATLTADHGALASLPLGLFSDGPMCGSGATAYDADLLRVRKVRTSIRVQTGAATLRGVDPLLFARPGSARASDRVLPDIELSLAVSPRNLQ